eukprot:12997446-Ditylum_brightwellii.AAC.1
MCMSVGGAGMRGPGSGARTQQYNALHYNIALCAILRPPFRGSSILATQFYQDSRIAYVMYNPTAL